MQHFYDASCTADPFFSVESVRVCIDTQKLQKKQCRLAEEEEEAGVPFDSADGAGPARRPAAGRIVSTARVYRRRARVVRDDAGGGAGGGGGAAAGENVKGGSVAVGALGDVATHPDYRKQGLAGLVLQDAFAYMQAAGCKISVLHSSLAAVAQYYNRNGYVPIPLRSFVLAPPQAWWDTESSTDAGAPRSVVQITPAMLAAPAADGTGTDAAIVRQVAELHRRASESLPGTFVRSCTDPWAPLLQEEEDIKDAEREKDPCPNAASRAYWRQWIPVAAASTGMACIALLSNPQGRGDAAAVAVPPLPPTVVGYMAVQTGSYHIYDGLLQIKEWGCKSNNVVERRSCFETLIKTAAANSAANGGAAFQRASIPEGLFEVDVWQGIMGDLSSHVGGSSSSSHSKGVFVEGKSLEIVANAAPFSGDIWVDHGQMYKSLSVDKGEEGNAEAVLRRLFDCPGRIHTFYSWDSF